MNRLIPLCAAFVLSLTSPLTAQDAPVVVELYTSQGCSSCPAADALMHELAGREDVIALALHVDYWDYIGWKDTFAHPGHAERQREYAARAGRRSIYTPEMIVQGQTDIVGAKPMELAKAIAVHADQVPTVALQLERDGDTLLVSADPLAGTNGAMTLHMLRYTPERTTEIERGENAGRTMSYANVVEGWTVLGDWDGKARLELTSEMRGDKPVVVIVQRRGTGPIVTAARLR